MKGLSMKRKLNIRDRVTKEIERLRKDRESREPACDHAWILNVKPNVCLRCGQTRKR